MSTTEMAEDIRWLREHSQEMQERYPDMYIAVYKGKVIAADKEFGKVYSRVKELGEKAIIEYIFSGDLVVL